MKKGLPPLDPLTQKTPITLEMLKGCAADQAVKFAPGDVLIVRSGWTEAFLALTDEERAEYNPLLGCIGVQASEEVMEWHWENGFAAVAGDQCVHPASSLEGCNVDKDPGSRTRAGRPTFPRSWQSTRCSLAAGDARSVNSGTSASFQQSVPNSTRSPFS